MWAGTVLIPPKNPTPAGAGGIFAAFEALKPFRALIDFKALPATQKKAKGAKSRRSRGARKNKSSQTCRVGAFHSFYIAVTMIL